MAWIEVVNKNGGRTFCNLEEAAFIEIKHEKRLINLVDVDGDGAEISYDEIVGMPENDQVNFLRHAVGLKPIR